ncbi:MAG: methionine adenosyltransferase [Armatimonadota bacterium]
MSISILCVPTVSVEHRAVELVERKGLGHPDTICDRAAEELSVELSRHYLDHFGTILHHNTDKVLLVGGRARATFGSGEVLDPSYLLLSGRATMVAEGEPIPVGEIAIRHTAEWLQQVLPHIKLPGDMIIDYRIKPSSPDLVALYHRPGVPLANDTSFAVAFAPFSELEQIVKHTEEHLNSAKMKQRYPQLGEDIKVMGLRAEQRIYLTVAVAFVAAETPDLDSYLAVKEEVAGVVSALASRISNREMHVSVNTADHIEAGSVYLTVTGTSAEQGDDGQVGRGNRATGLITPMRPMTLEAAAGKNPVSHVGKLYQVYTQLIVDQVIAEVPEVRAASCAMLSRIGSPINQPQAISLRLECDMPEAQLQPPIEAIVHRVLADWAAIRDGFLEQKWSLF